MGSSAKNRAVRTPPPGDLIEALAAAHAASASKDRPGAMSDYWRDQRKVLRWLVPALSISLLSWGTWITLEVFGLKTASAVAQSRAEAIQAQLARIELQITEINHFLRAKP
jgi:hypothetical protein